MRIDAPARESSASRRAGVDPAAVASLLAAAGDLAFEFAEVGPSRIEEDLVRFVQTAQLHGADALLGSIVLDRSRPDVVRQRAFGTMHHQVARQIGKG
ncbi:MAG TPA: hypothetical protein VEX15_18600 [Nocardioidaceae bacterium]|nr:hypothetical protein [Nocardioidaceae bacterium]